MKYVINTRGGAKKIDDKFVDTLLSQGFTQITKAQFEDRQYYPEFDKGPNNQTQAAFKPRLQNTKVQERKSFKTRIV